MLKFLKDLFGKKEEKVIEPTTTVPTVNPQITDAVTQAAPVKKTARKTQSVKKESVPTAVAPAKKTARKTKVEPVKVEKPVAKKTRKTKTEK